MGCASETQELELPGLQALRSMILKSAIQAQTVTVTWAAGYN